MSVNTGSIGSTQASPKVVGICHPVEKQDEGVVCLSFQARQKRVFIQSNRRLDHCNYSLVIFTP